MIGKCDVCGKTEEIYVCASTMGAVSLGYCKDCLQKGLEPYSFILIAKNTPTSKRSESGR